MIPGQTEVLLAASMPRPGDTGQAGGEGPPVLECTHLGGPACGPADGEARPSPQAPGSGVDLSYLLSAGGSCTVGVVLLQPRPLGLLPAL